MNGYISYCEICGALGHRKGHCPLRKLQEMQDPFGLISSSRPMLHDDPVPFAGGDSGSGGTAISPPPSH